MLLSASPVLPERRNDIFTLTQSCHSFFASEQSDYFHLHNCIALRELNNIVGFSTLDDALNENFEPCPLCRPTRRYDLVVSIPIENEIRENEKISDIEPMCKMEFYSYYYENEFLCVETPAGRWRIDTKSFPVKMMHINLIKSPNCAEFHVQPRIFLSFKDAFKYIKRHDEELLKNHGNSPKTPALTTAGANKKAYKTASEKILNYKLPAVKLRRGEQFERERLMRSRGDFYESRREEAWG